MGLVGVEGLIKLILVIIILFELIGILLLLLVFVLIYGFKEGFWYFIFYSINFFNNVGFSLYLDSFV